MTYNPVVSGVLLTGTAWKWEGCDQILRGGVADWNLATQLLKFEEIFNNKDSVHDQVAGKPHDHTQCWNIVDDKQLLSDQTGLIGIIWRLAIYI